MTANGRRGGHWPDSVTRLRQFARTCAHFTWPYLCVSTVAVRVCVSAVAVASEWRKCHQISSHQLVSKINGPLCQCARRNYYYLYHRATIVMVSRAVYSREQCKPASKHARTRHCPMRGTPLRLAACPLITVHYLAYQHHLLDVQVAAASIGERT